MYLLLRINWHQLAVNKECSKLQYAYLKWRAFAETFPLLFCFSVINTARKTQTQLWKTQTQPRKICKWSCTAFQKPMCVQTQRSSEEAFQFFGRNLRFPEGAFRFAEEVFQFAAGAAPQTQFWKAFQMSASFFFYAYRTMCLPFTHWIWNSSQGVHMHHSNFELFDLDRTCRLV